MDPSVRFRLETAFFFVAAVGFCATATYLQWFRTLDFAVHDALISALEAPLAEDLVIVGIDEQSLAKHGAWPWPRELQAQLLTRIHAANPQAVLVDIVYASETDPYADQALVDAAGAIPTLALPMLIDALGTNRQLIEVLPFPALLESTDVLGHAHVELDADAIARGVYLFQGIGEPRWPHVAHALADLLDYPARPQGTCPASGDFSLQNHRCEFVYLPFVGPPGSVPEVSAKEVLAGTMAPAALDGKLVFVGITTAAAPDSITSPVSGHGRPMPGVEFNINLFNALIQDRVIQPAALSRLMPVALACVILPVLVLPRLRPKAMLIAAVAFATVPLLISAAAHTLVQLQLPLASAVITSLLCYPYWSWRRHEIAWRFVEAELSRLSSERSRWVSEPSSTDSGAQSLGNLLAANAAWHDGSPPIEHARRIVIEAGSGRWLVLSRREPFSSEERRFAQKLQYLFDPPQVHDRLPGEMLAAQIRRLQRAAEEVRLGREVGQRSLDEMPIGVAVISALNEVLLANNAWRSLLAIDAEIEHLGLQGLVSGLVPPLGQTWQEISRAVLLKRQTITFETQTDSGTPVVVEAAPLAETIEAAEPWVITITDVSDVRIAERHREEALAFLSHDLRSPMLSVLALVRSAPGSGLLDDIGRYAQKALSVSEQFLQLSRVQARESFETYGLDLLSVLDNAVDHVFHVAKDKGITIHSERIPETDEPAWITGNGEMLERAFVNLLSNAIKYSRADSSVLLRLSEQDRHYVVEVCDWGVGIPADEQDRIFDPYFRSSEPRLAEQRGSGLGLRFVKTVVERHGGSIQVNSRLNEGSRFSVTLPKPGDVNA